MNGSLDSNFSLGRKLTPAVQGGPLSSSIGNLAAFAKLVEEFRPRLLAMIERRKPAKLAGRCDAEDIFADAMIVAQRKYHAYSIDSPMTPYAWLYRIVLDTLMERWRHDNRACRDPGKEMPWPDRSSMQLGFGLVDTGTSPSEAVARGELRERMRQTLNMLSANDRDILWMRHHDELSFKEAGVILEISESAATVRYVRALRRLKEMWLDIEGSFSR